MKRADPSVAGKLRLPSTRISEEDEHQSGEMNENGVSKNDVLDAMRCSKRVLREPPCAKTEKSRLCCNVSSKIVYS